jgi:endonuclease III
MSEPASQRVFADPPDEAELQELLELAKVGEQKAKKLHDTVAALEEKYASKAKAAETKR